MGMVLWEWRKGRTFATRKSITPNPSLKGREKPTPEPLPKRRGDGKEKREELRVIYI